MKLRDKVLAYEYALEQIANIDVDSLVSDVKKMSTDIVPLSGHPGDINYPYVVGALTAHLSIIVGKAKNALET